MHLVDYIKTRDVERQLFYGYIFLEVFFVMLRSFGACRPTEIPYQFYFSHFGSKVAEWQSYKVFVLHNLKIIPYFWININR